MQVGPYLHLHLGVRHMVSEDSVCLCRHPVFPADCPHRRIFTAHHHRLLTRGSERVPSDTRSFQHIAEFIDSAYIHCLAHVDSRITAGTDYTFTLFQGAGVLWRTALSGYQARLAISSLEVHEEVVTGAHNPLLRRHSSTSAAKYRFLLE